jgi:hypothetical protein
MKRGTKINIGSALHKAPSNSCRMSTDIIMPEGVVPMTDTKEYHIYGVSELVVNTQRS